MNAIPNPKFRLEYGDLVDLFEALSRQHYQHIGPVYRDGAIMIEEVLSFDDMASGYHEEIGPGTYKLEKREDQSLFQTTNGPQSFKKFLNPPRRKIFGANRTTEGIRYEYENGASKKMVFWGVRGCDLDAIHILDRVFIKGDFINEYYKAVREGLFIIGVNCTTSSSNCFCTSMGGSPRCGDGCHLLLTEVFGETYYLAEPASEEAISLFKKMGFNKAKPSDIEGAEIAIEKVEKALKQRFNPKEAAQLLRDNAEHIHWDELAKRCLSCANCTMVCPTCFCSSTEDITDLSGDHTERWLRWDSCFNPGFTEIHGGQIRNSTKSRYRQWMTHKLSSWYDQFGHSGCVGCGRCTTWCPVGIDITEELSTLKTQVNESA